MLNMNIVNTQIDRAKNVVEECSQKKQFMTEFITEVQDIISSQNLSSMRVQESRDIGSNIDIFI